MAVPYTFDGRTSPIDIAELDANFTYFENKFVTGTWTPTISFVTPGNLSVAYSVQLGTYEYMNGYVVCNFSITTSTFTHTTASGNLIVTGMPYSVAATPANHNWGGEMILWQGITKANYTQVSTRLTAGAGTSGRLTTSGSGQTGTTITAADMPTGGTVILQGAFRYRTA